MADVIDYKLYGSDLQMVEIELDPGEGVRAEAGAMIYMGPGIEMQTGGSGGLFGGFKRMLSGESFFITTFSNTNNNKRGVVGFGAPYPGKIVPIDLKEQGGIFFCQKDSFLCAAKGVDIEVSFTRKLGAGFFGGEGFILQKLTGDGLAFVHAGGTVIRRELAQGETMRCDTGAIVGFSRGVDYDIKFVGGFKNALFGAEGLFLATLTGPGIIYLQSLPLSSLANRLASAIRPSS